MSFLLNMTQARLEGVDLLYRVREMLVEALLIEKKKGRCSQTQIAEALGVDRSVINKQLNGAADMHITRAGEIAHLLGRTLKVSLSDNPLDEVGRNHRGPEIETSAPQARTIDARIASDPFTTRNSGGTSLAESAL